MSNDDLDHIPSIVPARDGPLERGVAKSRGNNSDPARKAGSKKSAESAGASNTVARLVTATALVAASVACVWGWQLRGQLAETQEQIEQYATRIGDLEARLSDTDQGMNQNAEVQAVKIAELEKEVRKLWDNVWKESKERLAKLEATATAQEKGIKTAQTGVANLQSQSKEATAQVARLSDDIAELKSISGDLARLMTGAKANQTEVERVADSLNRINLTLAKLENRVAGNEEWVASINAFRKQVNTSLVELQAAGRGQ
jgi:chromosome segregation ATPase